MNMQSSTHSADAATAEEGLAAQNMSAPVDSKAATAVAMQNTLLTPRFYTTDFDEMDAIDVSPVREDWDKLIAAMKADPNKGHFKKNEDWDHIDWDGMDPELRGEFIDFLISSCTAEFSGCVLYKEMKRRGSNSDITTLFQLMARDEARHAGFINDALREAGIAVNLGFLTQAKKYTYFRPKFIYYATYLSEKIGYARYITIYRHLEANPELRFHPIFKWFKEWCNDEFSHGEAFALLMKTDPKLTTGVNKLWIKFFLTAVFSTMWVRDHQRPAFHKALGVDPVWYGQEVFRKTSEISRQVFPLTLDIDHPRWRRGLDRLEAANRQITAAKKAGGVAGKLSQLAGSAKAGLAFLSLLTIPSVKNDVPVDTRLEPAY
ncbi:magnesium-protoporphyrin IX monomethyl ester (oxidative) cyclase [Ponticoccus sp. SC2-23]|uniref:magnesium-protoporphyrin IX monomethyl ester (oxidative) cyclase n=1 Tax=Alexandriicola marinus TaxID=2081710 RepID=UPI000FD7C027|nr:magnesium-protoporphyrin IX monomethyl ester (oxidative) cyclase [Alexandriicola marinus]MBM1221770.1 magnesium-protoporphyrin IX monomethyl ester (oxidative) cyclase [Ponticoccus sp. SC6-9]MBM1226121.1 magnesium-protoporphyrin IX monomethyl ester (oxidative) cyclase [Ponticoccus sp. SC6-15]MBM1230717.1 magnesium-protoporphyrin IX monomethyl ester (oxidative) cyclase [Ponticoccus sp. SC6-38]MBM1235442.1 magnesium-protoporphyrin IX monomethyl ester (oxidative) cyclase [Ponticoccus sp. SC6-45]